MIWEQYQRETKRKDKLSVIIPVVQYHGREVWVTGDRFSSVIDTAETDSADVLAGYIPDLRHQFCYLLAYYDNEITGKFFSRAILLAMKHIKDNDLDKRLSSIMQSLFLRLPTRQVKAHLREFLNLLFNI